MKTEAQKEHRWLQRLAGEWMAEGEAVMGPDQPAQKWQIPESVTGIGELWVQGTAQGDMPGCGPATTVMTLGYDPARKHFVGTFIGSMMTHLWVYEGDLDAGGQQLTLRAEGPDCSGNGRTVQYRDVIAFKDDNERTLTSFMQGENGEWTEIMKATYRRKR
ncbi:DUF1579 domain-containing protein [Cupriavidus oxalaticus]|uniref:DUF1579 domain-containing protein n=1 Tax=Cupriavidus oxalaticus TaxID=96344 RepID=A0A4P7L706_9BURK|nr:DUF1579 domain-containing protein [Cupriavidus oxalaticus]QBY51408.1 DUF1579 domain-containing protein [Cupriavidus oxalaticus]